MPNKRQAIIWTNDDPIHWRIYAALRGDELNSHREHPRLHISSNYFNILIKTLVEGTIADIQPRNSKITMDVGALTAGFLFI